MRLLAVALLGLWSTLVVAQPDLDQFYHSSDQPEELNTIALDRIKQKVESSD
ncbi:MAG: hypothetical protein ACFB10_10150 [Salibacteraceae bacterium]